MVSVAWETPDEVGKRVNSQEGSANGRVYGTPGKLLWAHQIPEPRAVPMMQSVKECIAVYSRPNTIENAYHPSRRERNPNNWDEIMGATSETGEVPNPAARVELVELEEVGKDDGVARI